MAYAYEVRVISWDRQAGAWRTLEPAGRIVAASLRDAKRQALARYGDALAPWQALHLRRIYFDTSGLKIHRRGVWHTLQAANATAPRPDGP